MTIQLHLGDCLEVLKYLPAGSVDAVIADPPYGMKWNSDTRRFSGGQRRACDGIAWQRIKGDDRPFDPSPWLDFKKVILWGSNHYGSRLPVGTTLAWVKKPAHLYGTFLSDAEIAWMKGGHGVYCCAYFNGHRKSLHPNQKPIDLMRWCIRRLKLKPGSTILDPYMGSGTVGIAAILEGHNYIGCEIDPEYFRTAMARIEAARASAVSA